MLDVAKVMVYKKVQDREVHNVKDNVTRYFTKEEIMIREENKCLSWRL